MDNTSLSAAINAQFLFQIGIFTAVPMISGFILEQGFLRVCLFLCAFMSLIVLVGRFVKNFTLIRL